MENLTKTITDLSEPISLKEYLRTLGLSVTLIKKVKFGGLFLNGKRVSVRATVCNGDLLKIIFPTIENESIPPISLPLKILYEDDYVVAIEKPSGMPTHPSKGNSLPTLANAVIAKYGTTFTFRAINRLDRDTRGIVLIAKDPISAAKLSAAMKEGKFHKKYTCTVEGVLQNSGRIDAPIRRESEDSIKRIVAVDGKNAITEYQVLEPKGPNTHCRIKLYTGRTHQIRVHMSHIGHPLVGDFLYGNRDSGEFDLKCDYLSFPHPENGETIEIHA